MHLKIPQPSTRNLVVQPTPAILDKSQQCIQVQASYRSHCPSPSFLLHKTIYLKGNKWWGGVKGKQQRGGEGVKGGDDNPAPSAATPSCQLSELWLLHCTLCTVHCAHCAHCALGAAVCWGMDSWVCDTSDRAEIE